VGSIKNNTENTVNTIDRRNETIISAIEKNSQLISQYDNAISDKLLYEIQKMSNKEIYTTIDTKIQELHIRYKSIQKLVYVIIVLLMVILIAGFLILIKNN
jgi:hypothetical protein